ncbi:MAG: M36 family metallopeptidase [Nocardioides sp.]
MSLIRNKSLTAAAVGSTVLAVSLLGLPSQAATHGQTPAARPTSHLGSSQSVSAGYHDARQLSGSALTRSLRQQVESRSKADQRYYRSLGVQSVVSMDPLTHTVRDLGKLNGYLTGRSSAPARQVALRYVRSHLSALGLHRGDLKTLQFRKDYVDSLGVHNLSWTQHAAGRTLFGNGLIVRVTRDGRVLAVQGSPVTRLAKLAAAAPTSSKVTASDARTRSASDVRGTLTPASVAATRGGASAQTKWSNGDFSQAVWFVTPSGLRPGWSTYVQTSKGAFQHVIDAVSGATLYRHSNTDDANGDADVYDNYPGAAKGGKAKVVNFYKRGWLKKGASFLKGSSVTAFADLNDDDHIQAREKTKIPGTKHGAQFKLVKFGKSASSFCKKWVCTWDPHTTNSWRTNMNEATANGFYFASNFHDWLQKKPISFTAAAGNFTAKGGDPVMLNTLDGADTDSGMPDGDHIDNANMATPPDGISPIMQMYLFHLAGASDAEDPFVPTTGSLDASVEYHEYTHGLSNRLVIDANGNSTLNSIQAGSMGEAWSDYYAMDYLVAHHFLKDTKKAGELLEGKYVAAGQHLIRTMAMDCPVGAKTKGCTSGAVAGVKGGYVYGDFPNVIGSPEVHGSGEIWGQTLWQLREKLGRKVTDNLVTRAMTMSAEDPDFLDMRNAIVRADLVAYHGKYKNAIWKVFANRGMGFFAGSIDSDDTTPASDFHMPPKASHPHDGKVSGTVTDATTGDPVAGALVQVTGQGYQNTAITAADGSYTIFPAGVGLVTGKYAKVVASFPGYLGDAHAGRAVRVNDFNPATDSTDFQITRDWAGLDGGASIVSAEGSDYSFAGCGPAQAFDQSSGTSWVTDAGAAPGTVGTFDPKTIEVKLPQAVDVDSFQVDPSETCGTGTSSATGDLLIETSPNGTVWTVAAHPTFDGNDVGHLNVVPATAGTSNVLYVRATIEANQTPTPYSDNCPGGGFGGCTYSSLTELVVAGAAAP